MKEACTHAKKRIQPNIKSSIDNSNGVLCYQEKNISKNRLDTKNFLEKKFLVLMLATFIINAITVFFSIYSNSMSLISDAVHGLFDVILMLGCFISVRLSRKKATNEFTYGYNRLETMVSITINIVFLCLLFMCIIQSLIRINLKLFSRPDDEEIVLNTKFMITSSSISIVGDLVIIYLMKTQREIKNFYHQFSRCC